MDFLNVYCLLYLGVQDNDNLRKELRDSFVNGYKEFKSRASEYNDFYKKIDHFIKTLKEKNALTEEGLSQIEEWQQLSEVEFQLDWMKRFKKQYVNE